MKKLIIPILTLVFLTGCPNEEEVKKMQEGVSEKKEAAIRFLDAKDYSLDGLLKIQEYFFDFSEKVVLITIEGEAQRNVQKLIAKRGGAREFCKNFVLPIRYWEPLEEYCKNGSFYKCSPEIREYKNTISKLYKVIGSAAARALTDESLCK